MKKLFLTLTLTFSFAFMGESFASASFHSAGWINTFIPGGGRLASSDNPMGLQEGSLEALFELGTFGLGWSLNHAGTLTLDGTTIDYPGPNKFHAERETNIALSAAVFQEMGIKTHFVHTFLTYREQFNRHPGDPGQGIDMRSMNEMFKDPFQIEILKSPFFYIPIALTSAFAILDYKSHHQNLSTIAPLSSTSKSLIGMNQLIVYPTGSGVPEEVFFRGFIQNEFYYLVRSPYFSIPMSSMFFALSHSQDDWSSAFASGVYQGMLAYQNNGNLALGNAVHFWGVVILGIEAYANTMNRQAHPTPIAANFQFSFE